VIPLTRPSGRPNRQIRLPARYRDELPPQPPSVTVQDPPQNSDVVEENMPMPRALHAVLQTETFRTPCDLFGMFRTYFGGPPSYTPDDSYTISDVADSAQMAVNPVTHTEPSSPLYAPFPNITTFRLMSWHYRTSKVKSIQELQQLVDEVILAPDFNSNDLHGFRATKEIERMDSVPMIDGDDAARSMAHDGWKESVVNISLPCDGVKHASEKDAPKFAVKGLYHRSLTQLLLAALKEASAEKFHLFPFKSAWKPAPDAREERVYSEPFTCDHFIEEYKKIQAQVKAGPKSHLTPVLLGLMIYSDATHLANFGTASAWPSYIYILNQSKYDRAKPSNFAAHHLAYIPKVRNLFHIVESSLILWY